jgi:hypothetical protein
MELDMLATIGTSNDPDDLNGDDVTAHLATLQEELNKIIAQMPTPKCLVPLTSTPSTFLTSVPPRMAHILATNAEAGKLLPILGA